MGKNRAKEKSSLGGEGKKKDVMHDYGEYELPRVTSEELIQIYSFNFLNISMCLELLPHVLNANIRIRTFAPNGHIDILIAPCTPSKIVHQ